MFPTTGGEGSLAFEVKALEVNTVSGPPSSSNSDQIVTTTTASMVSKGTIREAGDDYHMVPDQVQAHLRVLIQNNWQSEMERSKEDFPPSPSDRQSILVQLSKRCLAKGTAVKAPHFVRIKYYGNGDKPLGMFLRDTLFDTVIFPFPRCGLFGLVCGVRTPIGDLTVFQFMTRMVDPIARPMVCLDERIAHFCIHCGDDRCQGLGCD